jgi:hypothetical protein
MSEPHSSLYPSFATSAQKRTITTVPPNPPDRTEAAAREYVYRIDASDNIAYVDSEWVAFAHENGLTGLTLATVIGKPLTHFIADKETRHLYEMLLQKVRRTQRCVSVPLRCDGPEVRRYMEIRMVPLADDGVELVGVLLRAEPRPIVALLADAQPRSQEKVTICGWCKRISVAALWLEVEEAVARLGLFDSASLPQLTHGICPSCEAMVLAKLEEM